MTEDPIKFLDVSFENYDIDREAYLYWSNNGSRAWTKARFNGRDKLEKSVPVSIQQADLFYKDKISLNDWLSKYYPKQMSVCQKVLEQTRQQMLGI